MRIVFASAKLASRTKPEVAGTNVGLACCGGGICAFMISMLITLAKFMIVLFVLTIVCTVGWSLVAGELYDCTDPGFVDFLSPGNWVHSWPGHPVATVEKIVHGRSMSEPDTLKQGWSVARLWGLWLALVGVSLAVSLLLSRKHWFSPSPTLFNNRLDQRASPPKPTTT